MPEQPILYEQLTGIEFTRFIAALYTCTLSEKNEERIQHYFEKFEMTPYANRQIRHYSQGMKRKISLIAVLSYDPPILMLDEPTNGLDPKGIRQINSLLRELADRSKTVFVSTHILPIAEKLCDRLAIIDKGQLIAEGSLAELRQKSQMTTDLEEIFLNLTNPGNAETL